ncbi:MAG: apolipoprotein N-acyltransferase [bacterium JZ-2024 1]
MFACIALAGISGLVCGLSFDPGLGWMILLGLVPYIIAIARASPTGGVCAGLVFTGTYTAVALRWLSFYGWLPVIALIFIVFLPFGALAGGLSSGLGDRLATRAVLVVSGFLVFHEAFRQMGYASVPWTHLAHPLSPTLFPADSGLAGDAPSLLLSLVVPQFGVNGVSICVIACNAGLTFAILGRPRARLAGVLVAGVVIFLALVSAPARARIQAGQPAIRVAAIQTGTPTTTVWTPEVKSEVLREYESEVKKAQSAGAQIMVLPESFIQATDYPGSWIQQVLSRDWLERSRAIFYGAGFVRKIEDFPEQIHPALILLDKGGFREAILKHQLVPVGEYVPFRRFLVAWFPGYPWGDHDAHPAGSIRPVRVKGISVGALICYESLYPELARILSLYGAEFLISATNSSWMGHTKATEQMVRFEVFRSLESGKYFVRAGTSGISSIISPDGTIRKALPQFKTGFIMESVHPRQQLTFFTRHGDFLPWLIWSFVILSMLTVWLENGRTGSAHP